MTGMRRDARPEEDGQYPYPVMKPGEYGKDCHGNWMCCPPQPEGDPWDYFRGNISKHTVVEHADGTITVSPSILITKYREDGPREWHGYLENGIWRVC